MKALISCLFFCVINVVLYSQDSENQTITTKGIVPLNCELGIFAVGESSHGSHENNLLRNDLFKRMVEECETQYLFFEMNYGVALIINEYLVYDRISLDSAMKTIILWPWCTIEFASLLSWINEYNKGLAIGERVRIVGVNVQAINQAPKFVKCLLGESDYSSVDSMMQIFKEYYNVFPRKPLADYVNVLNHVSSILQNNEMHSNYDKTDQLLRENYLSHCTEILKYHDSKKYLSFTGRDSLMAKSFIASKALLLSKAPVFFYAHNAHVGVESYHHMNGVFFYSIGYQLKQYYGENYFNLGLDFSSGCVNTHKVRLGILGLIFGWETDVKPVKIKKEKDNLFLNQTSETSTLKCLKKNDLKPWFVDSAVVKTHEIGASAVKRHTTIKMNEDRFDGVLLFYKTSPTTSYFEKF